MKKIDVEFASWLSKKRESRRLKRLKNPKKSRSSSSIGNSKERIKIIIPPSLDLEDNRGQLISLIDEIQDVLLNKKNFLIDHRGMKRITKEALLLLTSEIERCTTIMDLKLTAIYKYFPKNDGVKNLLSKIGYWDYFNINSKKSKIQGKSSKELYLKIVGDTQVSGEKIGSLILFFEKLICFDVQTRDKFSDALMEAAANTVEHAYMKNQEIETIQKWWLTASLNTNTDEISFIFYDQGLGVLNTLESTQKHILLKRLVAGWIHDGVSKGGILKKLITTNLSSYKDERRGNGLISFKTFIDEVEGGELTIYTDDVSYSAISDEIKNYKNAISGTMIVWKIRANHSESKCIYIRGKS